MKANRIVGLSILLSVSIAAQAMCYPLTAFAAANDRQGSKEQTSKESDETAEDEVVRDIVSAYVMQKSGFMDSGAYEKYVEGFIESEDPPNQEKPQDRTEDQPRMYFDFMGMDRTVNIMKNSEIRYNRAFLSSLFYMEVPEDWYVGGGDICPMVFCHESDKDERGPEDRYKTYMNVFPGKDIFNENASDEVAEFVLEGGIDKEIEDAMGKPLTSEYTLEQEEPGSTWFYLKKDGQVAATIYAWENIGQVAIWNNEVQVKVKASEDHGRVLVFEEWADQDFSTRESIRDYVESGNADHLIEPVLGEGGAWTCSEYSTEYHDFLRFEGSFDKRRAAFYIPVTPDSNENWVILFESSDQTKVEENAYDMQERIIKTFILQPYYYVVKKRDTLSGISKKYTDHPDNYLKIAEYKPNHRGIRMMNPNRIYPGQRIVIPLDLLFQKKHYQ